MQMTESEIKVNVLQAKNKRAQIKICADLNDTTEDVIKGILKKQGVDLRALNNFPSKKQKKQAETNYFTALNNRISELLAQRKAVDDELANIKAELINLTSQLGER